MNDQLSLLSGLDSQQHRIVYFDLETLRSADEVGGWANIDKMGMACAVCFDSKDHRFITYEEADVKALVQHLMSADLVVGFNQLTFDYQVLSGYSNIDYSQVHSFDILQDVTRRLGHRLKLDSLVKATLKRGKSSDGMQSLEWVRQGRLDLVKDYCKIDVEVTRDLFLFGVENGQVFYSSRDQKVELKVDWDIQKLVRRAAS